MLPVFNVFFHINVQTLILGEKHHVSHFTVSSFDFWALVKVFLAFLGWRVRFFYETIPLLLSWQRVFFWGSYFLFSCISVLRAVADGDCEAGQAMSLDGLFLFNLFFPCGKM